MAGHAHATIAYNQDLIAPGVYFGTGNGNGFWAIDNENGVELGLRAKLRQQGPSASDNSGTYGAFAPGTQTAPSPNPNRATWNYEFSINVRGDGNATRTFNSSGFTFQLCVDGTSCVDPLSNWSDNGLATDVSGVYGAQNSEQLLFPDSPGNSGYDINALGLYNFTLTAFNSSGEQIAQTAMSAKVPEPATLAVFGLGLAGLGAARRRRRHPKR